MYKCVTQNPHTQHASIIALECRLYVTFNHNPEGKLETLLNVFDQVESTGPDVASMIRQVSTMCYYTYFTCSNTMLIKSLLF